MNKNGEKTQVQQGDAEGLNGAKAAPCASGATTLAVRSSSNADESRPEIDVLGWNARSYRLAMRGGKA
jgi:hypothetical protein